MALSFDDGSVDPQRWEQEERPEYAKRASMVGAATLMTNYLGTGAPQADVCYGGAMVVPADGSVLDCFPLGQEGILFVDLRQRRRTSACSGLSR